MKTIIKNATIEITEFSFDDYCKFSSFIQNLISYNHSVFFGESQRETCIEIIHWRDKLSIVIDIYKDGEYVLDVSEIFSYEDMSNAIEPISSKIARGEWHYKNRKKFTAEEKLALEFKDEASCVFIHEFLGHALESSRDERTSYIPKGTNILSYSASAYVSAEDISEYFIKNGVLLRHFSSDQDENLQIYQSSNIVLENDVGESLTLETPSLSIYRLGRCSYEYSTGTIFLSVLQSSYNFKSIKYYSYEPFEIKIPVTYFSGNFIGFTDTTINVWEGICLSNRGAVDVSVSACSYVFSSSVLDSKEVIFE